VVVLVKQDLYSAFLCRAWARNSVFESIHPLLGTGDSCPFDTSSSIPLLSDDATADHYLELLLGRGRKDLCPQAEKVLAGIARDMVLNTQPYLCSVLAGRAEIKAEESVLSILQRIDGAPGQVPRDLQGDLALVVATKALELVQVLGLDL